MRIVPVDPLPNQAVNFVIDENFWQLRVSTRKQTVLMDVKKNGDEIVLGARCVAGAPIIMPASLSPGAGFAFITQAGELVDYTKFGVSQFLFYFDATDFPDDENRFPFPLPFPDEEPT
jgi:hypothetical protein